MMTKQFVMETRSYLEKFSYQEEDEIDRRPALSDQEFSPTKYGFSNSAQLNQAAHSPEKYNSIEDLELQ